MRKIAFIDLDGTVCNNQKRFEQATSKGKIDWEIAFDPLLLDLDELIVAADQTIEELAAADWTIIYLSSRPENLLGATKNWLKRHGLAQHQLVLKPPHARRINTPKWKASVVCTLGANAEQVLFVDDETQNVVAVRSLWRERVGKGKLQTISSLELARKTLIAGATATELEIDSFFEEE